MSDILSQGHDREPGPWRRRLVVLAVVAAVLAVVVLTHLPRHRPARPHPAAAVVVAGPNGITGRTLPWAPSLRLPVATEHPALLSPASGRLDLIEGLPLDRAGYGFTQVGGGWAVQAAAAQPVPRAVCDTCAGAPQPVYFLSERSHSATLVAQADAVAPAATGQAMWLTTYPQGVSLQLAAGTAREVGATGRLLSPAVRLPAGFMIVRGTVRGLLLAPVVSGSGAAADEFLDPSTRHLTTSPFPVMAASATEIAGMMPCGTGPCRLTVLNLGTPRPSQVVDVLQPGSSVASAAFSSDGRYLALQVNSAPGSADSGLETELQVLTTATGSLATVPDTALSSDALIGYGWPPGSDRLVAELSFTTKVQLASWQPGAGQLAVAVVRAGSGAGSIVTG